MQGQVEVGTVLLDWPSLRYRGERKIVWHGDREGLGGETIWRAGCDRMSKESLCLSLLPEHSVIMYF